MTQLMALSYRSISKKGGTLTTKDHPDENLVNVLVNHVVLEGSLGIPEAAQALILFAHGSGSSRLSPRNQFVARVLRESNLGTLLIDLLTAEEEEIDMRTAEFRFDIELLARRLIGATDWLTNNPTTKKLRIGYFGASTGAAAALIAASARPQVVNAVVSRGGRPDLAKEALPLVKAPTLLIVGGHDYTVIEMNKEAFQLIEVEKKLLLVPEATHLFEEPGALEEVAKLAADWFTHHLASQPR